jgi:hypothetical protein
MHERSGVEVRLRQAATLPDTLAASFDAFEVIRFLARGNEDRVPGLFAAFMTAADAAVDGREAVTAAPSLPSGGGGGTGVLPVAPGADVGEIADDMAALAVLLGERLGYAATLSTTPADLAACEEAAETAGRICQLMTRGHDDTRLR